MALIPMSLPSVLAYINSTRRMRHRMLLLRRVLRYIAQNSVAAPYATRRFLS
jgi:hypothetical protein